MEAMPDPFRPGHHLLRVGVQGDEISRSERAPVHLTFLADVSGSMSSGDKLPLAKEAMHMLVDGLREDDTVGLCTYAGRVARVLEPTSAANKRAIHDAIEALNSGGSTAMSSGIDIAYEMAWETFEEGHENRVIIMSDGDANVGNTSWEQMLANIKGYADRGVTVSTIGFGMGNYKDTLMEQLSNNGDGNNYYIDDRDQAQRVFVEDLGGTMVTIARDVKIQVDFNPESVYSYRLIGYENRDIADVDFRNDRVDAGEIGSGHNVTALYDVILRDGYARELATVRMRWETPGADKAATEKAFRFSHSALKETSYLTSRSTRIAYSAATFAEILRGSPHAAEISLERLAKFATQAARPGNKDDMELVTLMNQAAALGVQNVASVY
jgi:Ca-activated chloride channel family protein